jgi:beta-galactosidase
MGEPSTRPRLGVAYYPEHWSPERWPADAELMVEAGISLARVGEFAWAQLEPEEGRFDFAWLDQVLGLLGSAGIEVVLGTPTAAPPIWLVERYPEILPVAADGTTRGFGHRRHYCPNNPAFHAATKRIVCALADRYGRDTRVVAWQTDNELGGRCFCERCRRAFHEWLERRYDSLEVLNEQWGTAFWSQTYTAWEQIPLPEGRPVPLPRGFLRQSPNPGLALDFRRFASDSYVAYQRLQVESLRARCDERQRITHNLMGFRYDELDYHAFARDLDFVSWDNYPLLDESGRWSSSALAADAMRGLKGAQVWVLEQQAGPLGWEVLRTPRRGQLRLYAYQAFAHGADAVFFFRWKTGRHGTEQYWHGIVDHDGRGRRRLAEVAALAEELDRVGDRLGGALPLADAAIVNDYDSRFALQIQPTSVALSYEETIQRHYEALRRLGLGVDVVAPDADLSPYPLVVAADMFVLDEAVAAQLRAYVAGGGHLVLAPRVGVKDRANALPDRPFPAWLDDLAGLEVIDYAAGTEELTASFVPDDGSSLGGAFAGWFEEVELKGARALASYRDGEFAGTPAVARNDVDGGRVTYLAGAAGEPTLRRVYRSLAAEEGLRVRDLPDGVELVSVENAAGEQLYVLLNHAAVRNSVELDDGSWHELLGDERGEAAITLEPFGIAIVDSTPGGAEAPRERSIARAHH